jgi:hypothetical protein
MNQSYAWKPSRAIRAGLGRPLSLGWFGSPAFCVLAWRDETLFMVYVLLEFLFELQLLRRITDRGEGDAQ